ncbi:helix-turn-helix domain-containing protein [Paenibacillus sp. ACRRX]|uniref:helix-turn-helix domain-containing protein n=1 Tax=Paenibacillus sp. ACRRX TaxID=2918206 RepID=UPI001EF63EB9|nr:helix-turn-helix transcriptional regulator [Paenibacillus sp. ACRRX]MCG7409175.1 helix-turn-helix domain-containing protein [Paenibacillus sp. ACRRX]
MKIGEKLRNIRHAQGLTSTELSKRSGVTQSTISDIENDNRSPQIDTLIKLCKALSINISALLTVEEMIENTPSLRENETEFIRLFHEINESQKEALVSLLHSFVHHKAK